MSILPPPVTAVYVIYILDIGAFTRDRLANNGR